MCSPESLYHKHGVVNELREIRSALSCAITARYEALQVRTLWAVYSPILKEHALHPERGNVNQKSPLGVDASILHALPYAIRKAQLPVVE